MCPKGRTQNRNGGKMKKKAVEKVEMKESLLKGEALALNDAELEGAAGGGDVAFEGLTRLEMDRRPIVDENSRQEPQPPTKENEEIIREFLESQWYKDAKAWVKRQNYDYSGINKYLG